MVYDRAAGTFKDPNVLGSYLILGALYCMQLLMLGQTRWRLTTAAILLLLLAGVFLTFSRGSWLAFGFAALLMIGLTIITTGEPGLRRKMILGAAAVVALTAVLVAILMSFDSVQAQVFARTAGDQYEDLRYFNQWRSLPDLLESPLGYGPLRFRLIYDLEPHSSYVNAFASYGWLGGFTFLSLVASSIFIGFRLCFAASPFRRLAQLFFPALLAFLLQGFQIDIDHWRHVFLLLGALWGFEAARRRWLERGAAAQTASS